MFCRKGQPIHFRQNFLYAGKCQKTSAFVFFSCSQRLRTRINPLARPRHDGSSPAYYSAGIVVRILVQACAVPVGFACFQTDFRHYTEMTFPQSSHCWAPYFR